MPGSDSAKAAAELSRYDPGRIYTGLLVDFGGVLTTDVFDSFRSFCATEGLAVDTVREKFMGDPTGRQLLFDLETGTLAERDFEVRLAALLELEHSDGLISRLFGAMAPDTAMLEAVRAARRAGVRTGMISNSWGQGSYDRSLFPELFDGVVISAEEGMRKPDPPIYRLGAQRVGLEPSECVFVDDLAGNLKPARALGMATVHHRGAETTIPELERLLGVALR